MRKSPSIFLLTLILLSIGTVKAQSSFVALYGAFSQKFNNVKSYQFSADIKVYNDSSLIQEYSYQLKQFDNQYFMKMGNTERIMSKTSVITMNREHRSIMLSSRTDNEVAQNFSLSSLRALDSLVNLGVIKPIPTEDGTQAFIITIEKGGYNTIELYFKNSLLSQIVTYYAIKDSPITKSVVNFQFDFESSLQPEYFSMDRYAYVNSAGQYVLKSEFKDFELTLN